MFVDFIRTCLQSEIIKKLKVKGGVKKMSFRLAVPSSRFERRLVQIKSIRNALQAHNVGIYEKDCIGTLLSDLLWCIFLD